MRATMLIVRIVLSFVAVVIIAPLRWLYGKALAISRPGRETPQ